MKRAIYLLPIATLFIIGTSSVKAAVVTSIAGGTLVPMPAVEYFGPGPQAFGPGITWSSTNSTDQGGSVFGFTGGYGFSVNGVWDSSLGPMAGVNNSTDAYGPPPDTMTFAFSTPVAAVGGFLNYVPGSLNATTIAIYDAANNLLESYALTFLTGGGTNTGQFFGFEQGAANISYFRLTDNYIAVTQLTIRNNPLAPNAVPEPSSIALFTMTSLLFGCARWRRRNNLPTA
jgi:hypothetical protein